MIQLKMAKGGKTIKTITIYLLILSCTYDYASSYRTDFNMLNLLNNYVSVCGIDFLCDTSWLNRKSKPDLEYKHLHLCPPCFCDDLCLEYGDCCPDLFFSLPEMICDDLYILNPPMILMKANSSNYQIVSSCPSNSDDTIQRLCNNAGDVLAKQLISVPVTGQNMSITYRNKYCAQCNNEHNVTEWNLDIDCELFADFNFLNTLDEIAQQAIEKRCGIKFIPDSLSVHVCPKESDYDSKIINKCNETGQWSAYDVDIDKACESTYDLTYRIFKNIFCYICNPSIRNEKEKIISNCNTTGFWAPKDIGLENACQYHILSERTNPFKNVFCFMCNRDNFDIDFYVDMSTELVENRTFQNPDIYSYYIKTLFFKNKYYDHIINEDKSSNFSIVYGGSINELERTLSNGQKINITSLVRTHFAYEGQYKYCGPVYIDPDRWFLQVFLSLCECGKVFLDYSSKPCIDFGLNYPSQCQSNRMFSNRESKYSDNLDQVTIGCYYGGSYDVIKRLCESENTNNIFQALPVSHSSSNEKFKNIFCSICNEGMLLTELVLDRRSGVYMDMYHVFGTPWDINIQCENVLDFNNYVTLYELLLNARNIKCNVTFTPKKELKLPRTCPPMDDWVINKCNITGYWSTYDPDVEWACEQNDHDLLPNVNPYKNVYCIICNPHYTNESVISRCNETGLWDKYSPNIERACSIYPKVDTSFPYKNYFCKECNTIASQIFPVTPEMTTPSSRTTSKPEIEYPFTFRSVFSLNQFEDEIIANNKSCATNEIYDVFKKECRNVTCYPGKLIVNDSCIPLLKVTTKLRYILTFVMEGQSHFIHPENTSQTLEMNYLHILPKIKRNITDQLTQSLYLRDGEIRYHQFNALGHLPCNSDLANSTDIKILLNIDLFILGYVDRLETEKFLLDFVDGKFSVSINGINLISVKSKEAMYLPSMLNKADQDSRCFVGLSDYSFLPDKYYRSTLVDSVMICQQIELGATEFELDDVKMELKFKIQNVNLDFDQYKIISNGNARVCLNSMKDNTPLQNNYTTTVLSLLTLICVSISLFCLFVTFITYCIFPSLRTLPGKNLMILIFTMFCTEICFVSGYRPITTSAVCLARALLSHLFWLASFCCMNVCTIHMYRVFGKSKLFISNLHKNNTMFRHYVLYSYGIPVVLCGLNLVINLGMSSGTNTGYGGQYCFLVNRISFIVTFIVPITCVCLANICLFSVTIFYIHNTNKVQSNKPERREVFIYVRLFALTGITWILQIVDSFLQLSVFSYIVTILIGLQGLYIFISYVCTSRVLSLYKGLRCRPQREGHQDSSRSRATTDTSLPLSRVNSDS